MALKQFSLLKEDVRLLRCQNSIYKIKIFYESKEEPTISFSTKDFHMDLEKVLRAVIYGIQQKSCLNKIHTDLCIVNVKFKPWKASHKLGFRQNGKEFNSHPFMIILNVTLKPNPLSRTAADTPHLSSGTLHKLTNEALHSNVRVVLNKLGNFAQDGKQNDSENNNCVANDTDKSNASDANQRIEQSVDQSFSSSSKETSSSKKRNIVKNVSKFINDKKRNSDKVEIQSVSEGLNSKAPKLNTKPASRDDKKDNTQRKYSLRCPLSVGSKASRALKRKYLAHPSRKLSGTPKNSRNMNQVCEGSESRRLSHHTRTLSTTSSNYSKQLKKSQGNTEENVSTSNNANNILIHRSPRKRKTEIMQLKSSGIDVNQLKSTRQDRHFIECEELAEDMKLQQLAKSSPNTKRGKTVNRTRKSPRTRTKSGLWKIMETFISPVKSMFHK